MEYKKKISLTIDSRENVKFQNILYEEIKDLSITTNVAMLSVGDILITDGTDSIIIERKTHQDLGASIIDGRSHEQASRLKEIESDNTEVYYLIENCLLSSSLSEDTIRQAIVNKQIRDKFKIMRTNSMKDSALYIRSVLKSLGDFGFKGDNAKTGQKEKIKIKKKNNSPLVLSLCALKGVSFSIAVAIDKTYLTMFNLICAFNQTKASTLIGINITDKRKIGKVMAEKIYNALCNSNSINC